MIFPGQQGNYPLFGANEPFVVPIAIPLIDGPSALATIYTVKGISHKIKHNLDIYLQFDKTGVKQVYER